MPDELNGRMLPGSLKDRFDGHREDLLKEAESLNENHLSWFLHEINVLGRESEPLTSFGDAFDPFLRLRLSVPSREEPARRRPRR
jgi:hypothetical protein